MIVHTQTEFTSELLFVICFIYVLWGGGCFFSGLGSRVPCKVLADYSGSGVFGGRVPRPEVIEVV